MGKLTIYNKNTKLKYDNCFDLLFCLDYSLSSIIYPLLEKFKDLKLGYPGNLTEKKWLKILDKMIWAHKFIVYDMCDEQNDKEKLIAELGLSKSWSKSDYKSEEYIEANKKCEEGLKLFAKYYRALWY
jgi:hypothetical protein